MIIRFDVTFEDHLAFNRQHQQSSPTARANKLVAQVVLVFAALAPSVVGAAYHGVFPQPYRLGLSVLLAVAAVTAYTIAYPWIVDRQARKFWSEGSNRGVQGLHEVEIDSEGITERANGSVTRQPWNNITKIVETDSHVFLYFATMQAFMICGNAVVEGDPAQFMTLARQYWADAKGRGV